jgi:hypothetical protein
VHLLPPLDLPLLSPSLPLPLPLRSSPQECCSVTTSCKCQTSSASSSRPSSSPSTSSSLLRALSSSEPCRPPLSASSPRTCLASTQQDARAPPPHRLLLRQRRGTCMRTRALPNAKMASDAPSRHGHALSPHLSARCGLHRLQRCGQLNAPLAVVQQTRNCWHTVLRPDAVRADCG